MLCSSDSITSKNRRFFIAEINDREKMSNTLNKHITALDNAGKTWLILLGLGVSVSLFSFTSIIGTPAGIASAIIGLVFLLTNRIIKLFPKTIGKKKTQKKCFIGQE